MGLFNRNKKKEKVQEEFVIPTTVFPQDILSRSYSTIDLGDPWTNHIGVIPTNCRELIWGKRKNGKTTYTMRRCKRLTQCGLVVYYNSIEEGENYSIQEVFDREKMGEIPEGQFHLGNRHTLKQMYYIIEKEDPDVIVIDSRDYLKLTTRQYMALDQKCPDKMILITCWERGGKPEGKFAQDMEYMVDITTHIANFIATPQGRYGGGELMKFRDLKPQPGDQLEMV